MIAFLDGVEVRMYDGCFAVIDRFELSGDAILNGRGDYCNSDCAARALNRKPPKYRCPDCVHKGEQECHHYRTVPANTAAAA